MPPTDRKGTLFGGDAVHVALILQTRATARRARNTLSRLLRRYHAAEPASARDRGTIVRKHISGLHRRGVSTAVHSAWPVGLKPISGCFVGSRKTLPVNLEHKDLSYAIAKTIAENALADCKRRAPSQIGWPLRRPRSLFQHPACAPCRPRGPPCRCPATYAGRDSEAGGLISVTEATLPIRIVEIGLSVVFSRAPILQTCRLCRHRT